MPQSTGKHDESPDRPVPVDVLPAGPAGSVGGRVVSLRGAGEAVEAEDFARNQKPWPSETAPLGAGCTVELYLRNLASLTSGVIRSFFCTSLSVNKINFSYVRKINSFKRKKEKIFQKRKIFNKKKISKNFFLKIFKKKIKKRKNFQNFFLFLGLFCSLVAFFLTDVINGWIFFVCIIFLLMYGLCSVLYCLIGKSFCVHAFSCGVVDFEKKVMFTLVLCFDSHVFITRWKFSAIISVRWSGAELHVPGADHILAQPLKRCSVSRIKPNETFKLAKKRQNILCFGVCGRKNFLMLSPSYMQSLKNREKSLCPTVLELRWVISTWWDENMTLFVFSACHEIHWNWFCGRKQAKNAKIRKWAFFSRRVLW